MGTPLDILRQLAAYGTLDDPQVAAQLSIGLSGFVQRWRKEALPFVAAGGAELRFIEAPYGRGKTHFLQTLEVTAGLDGFVTCRVQCGLQHQPFQSLADTYRATAGSMRHPTNGNGAQCGIAHLVSSVSREQLQFFQGQSRINPAFRNLVASYARLSHVGQTRDPVSCDLRALLHHDSGRRVTFKDLFQTARNLGVTLQRPLGRIGKRNAAVWLRSILTLPRQLGFKGLVVLFDETGSDLHLRPEPRKARQQHMANLRNLVDHLATGGIPGCSIVYATTHDFVQMAREDYPALAQRVERLEEITPFTIPTPNPRAIWCRLDELTHPAPDSPDFFDQLGDQLLSLGRSAGISERRLSSARDSIHAIGSQMYQSSLNAVVREFIKRAAGEILQST